MGVFRVRLLGQLVSCHQHVILSHGLCSGRVTPSEGMHLTKKDMNCGDRLLLGVCSVPAGSVVKCLQQKCHVKLVKDSVAYAYGIGGWVLMQPSYMICPMQELAIHA